MLTVTGKNSPTSVEGVAPIGTIPLMIWLNKSLVILWSVLLSNKNWWRCFQFRIFEQAASITLWLFASRCSTVLVRKIGLTSELVLDPCPDRQIGLWGIGPLSFTTPEENSLLDFDIGQLGYTSCIYPNQVY
jgi:hypothetical protein